MMGKSLPVVKHWPKFLFANFVNSYNGFSHSFGIRKLRVNYTLLSFRIITLDIYFPNMRFMIHVM